MRRPREAAVFVYRGDRFLLLRRVRDHYWNVAAGQVEPSETVVDAAVRELREETGLEAGAGLIDLAIPIVYPVPDDERQLYEPGVAEVTLQSFAVEAPADWEPVLDKEHDEHRWCDLREALELLHWPGARECVRLIAARRAGTASFAPAGAGGRLPPTAS